MKQKIAIVDPASYTLPYDFYYIREVAKTFCVDFYCSTSPFNWEYAKLLKDIPNVNVFPYRISAVSKIRGFFNYLTLLTKLFFRRSEYSAIHFQFQILKGFTAWIELAFFGMVRNKFIFTMHSPVPHGYSRKKTYWVFRYIARLAQRLVFASSYSHDRFVRDYNYTREVTISPLGLMPLEPGEPLPNINFSPAEKTVIFWGNVKPYKGIDLLADMVESGQFNGFRFEVYGKWDPRMSQLLERLKSCNIRVINCFLDNDKLRELLQRPVIFIFPYLNVTQSGVLYTLLFYGACFVTSNSGDNAHFASRHNMKEIIFDRNDFQSIGKSLEYVIQNKKSIVEKLREIRGQYRWDLLTPDPRSIYTGKARNQK